MDELDVIEGTTHKIYHHFCDYMKRWYYAKRHAFSFKTFKETKQIIREFDPSKMVGYSAMQKVKRYKEKYGGIETISVDDDMFMGSMIVLIPHDKMGITCIYIPQCINPSNTFFLYPCHIKQLSETIAKMCKEYNLKEW
jgi:hypothetical protein